MTRVFFRLILELLAQMEGAETLTPEYVADVMRAVRQLRKTTALTRQETDELVEALRRVRPLMSMGPAALAKPPAVVAVRDLDELEGFLA
jgi:hypothetical protein